MNHAILILLTLCCGAVAAADTVVVNPSVDVATLGEDQFKDIYLGRKTSWDSGAKITVVLSESGPGNDALMARLGKNSSQFTTGWKKLVFTGKGAMPEMVKDDAAVLALVAKTPGAIGYIAGAAGDGVKAVTIK